MIMTTFSKLRQMSFFLIKRLCKAQSSKDKTDKKVMLTFRSLFLLTQFSEDQETSANTQVIAIVGFSEFLITWRSRETTE